MNPHPLRDDPKPEEPYTDKLKNDPGISNLPPISGETLMQIFDFDEIELNANRRGFVTNHQKQRLLAELRNDANSMWLMLTVMLGVSAVLGVIVVTQGIPMIALVIGAGIIAGGLLLASYWQQSELRQDAENIKVRHIQGKAFVQWGSNRSGARLTVGNQSFSVGIRQASALNEYDLQGMRVYFSQNSKRLLSIEPIYTHEEKLKVEEMDDADLLQAGRDYSDIQQQERKS